MIRDIFGFLKDAILLIFKGGALYWAWLLSLGALFLVGVYFWVQQIIHGLSVTNLTDEVPWGAYIANFTYVVGMIDAAVMVMIPAYLYGMQSMRKIVLLSLNLGLAAVIMALLFVSVDIGAPDKNWHMMPGLGWLRWPGSMLAWDVVVLLGWFIINAFLVAVLLFRRWAGLTHPDEPAPRWWVRTMYWSIFWAVGLHVVTAFLYSWIGARSFWNSAVVAPRFIASAFVAGPAFFVIALYAIRRFTERDIPEDVFLFFKRLLAVTMAINLFLFGSELFVELFSTAFHRAHAVYLFFGLHGHDMLVPFIWTAIGFNVVALVVFVSPLGRQPAWMILACALAVVGVWTEKGMGIVVPGFVPGTLGEMVEYFPSVAEFFICAAIYALGGIVFTILVRVTYPIELGIVRKKGTPVIDTTRSGAAAPAEAVA